MSWKTIRVTVLLLILAVVGLDAVLEEGRLTTWDRPLRVVVYPINADNSEVAASYISGLSAESFGEVGRYLTREAGRHNLAQSDLAWVNLSPPITHRPPAVPYTGGVLSVMSWSLKLRYWMWRNDNYDGIRPEIRILALYHDPATHPLLPHSTGLKKGRIAIAHLFAGKQGKRNNVVLTHELLHTLGASDKYDLATTLPIYPSGYAEPEREPLHPQRRAEIMGGRVPLTPALAEIPESLAKTQVGAQTAQEIGWL